MIDQIKLALKEFKVRWKILKQVVKGNKVYLSKAGELENYAESLREEYLVTVYSKGGDSTFKVVDASSLKKQIKDAIYAASLLKNPKYGLCGKQIKKAVKLVDSEVVEAKDLKKKIFGVVDSIKKEFKRKKNVKLNGVELFIDLVETDLVNSKGLKLNSKHTKMYVEAVITSFKGRKEQEHLGVLKFRRFKDFNVKEFVDLNCRIAVDALNAKNGKTYKGAVVLRSGALDEFWSPLLDINPAVMHCSAKLKKSGASRYNLGKEVISNVIGDKLTIYNNALVDHNYQSYNFDSDGVVGKRVCLIKNNKFKNYLATKQFADYMKIKPSGPVGVVEVECGNRSLKSLYKGKVFEIVSFSSFTPNEVSGDFAAEVRLGYLIEKGVKKPVRGVVFTGNVFELFKNVLLSKEKVNFKGYLGPRAVRFNEGLIAGH
jgi:predicted Zn-dependent protease